MIRCFRRFALALLVAAGNASAQAPDTATLKGQIIDQSRAAIAGADITLKSALTTYQRNARSDSLGTFSVSGLPIGTYTFTIHKDGFSDFTRELTLVAGTTADIKIQLNVSAVQTQIQVTGTAGEVRTDEPQLGDRLGSVQVEETPLLNRRITYLPLLNAANRPAINQGDVFMNQNLFTTNGAGRRQTWFEIDGSTGNDSWGRQTTFTALPLMSLQEMTVLSNAFSAEFGGSTGSVVNIVTKSGASDFHGELLELWRPAETSAALSGFTASTATTGNAITSDSLGQSALGLSGPLGGRTFFSVGGEFSRQDRGSPVI